jgi:predicted  nucleic acid-binding Zn-ribbon protein
MSEPESPTSSNQSEGHYSEVATEPLPESERQLVYEYMSRRQHFLSDYERYNPVQNMQMLANHVFDLSENIYRLKSDFTSSRRLLDIVSANQRDGNESIMNVGNDLGGVGQEVHVLKEDMYNMKEDMHNMKDDMHNMKDDVSGFRSQVTDDLGGLRQDINTLRSELHAVRSETQQGLLELKQMLSMLVSVRV